MEDEDVIIIKSLDRKETTQTSSKSDDKDQPVIFGFDVGFLETYHHKMHI
jgi:hypothetical protein